MTDCGVAVVGSGVAGLMAAIAAAGAPDAVLFTDGPLGRSNSSMAQGGLQLPPPGAEALQRFGDDMRRSARVPLDPARVAAFVAHVDETIACLVDWGLELDRDDRGAIARHLAGGLSEPRIVSSRDQIGPAIMKVLLARVRAARVHVADHARVVDVRPAERGFVLDVERAGACERWHARAVVCCTGGVTYREARRRDLPTTNPANENHVLFDRLAAAGLPLEHADFFQYQPYGLAESGREPVGRCVPESIVNFRVRLLDRHGDPVGEIGQDRYELTRRMFACAEADRAVRLDDGSPGLWLTLGDVDPDAVRRHFPKLAQYLERHGGLGRDALVFPFLHYYLGGFRVDARCESPWRGLFLAGEMVGGLHGRNRLMGNGITDSLVHGRLAGHAARGYAG